jgi:hypothetical protein
MGGQCYVSGSVSMSRQAIGRLLAQESDVRGLLREAVNEGTLSYSDEDNSVVLDGMYVSWEADSVIEQLANNKDIESIDPVEWTGEGHNGPLSDILVYFLGCGRWLAKAVKPPRLSSRERAWLVGREPH